MSAGPNCTQDGQKSIEFNDQWKTFKTCTFYREYRTNFASIQASCDIKIHADVLEDNHIKPLCLNIYVTQDLS